MINYFISEPIRKEERTNIFLYFPSTGNYGEKVSRFRKLRFWIVNKILQSLNIKIEVRDKIIAPVPCRQEEIEAEDMQTKEIIKKENLETLDKMERAEEAYQKIMGEWRKN